MTTQNLTEFFREKRVHAGVDDVDWGQRRREYVEAVDGLYQLIVGKFLAPALASGSVAVSYRSKSITEEFLGNYEVRELVLHVGDEIAVFSPKGRNIVGVSGRVDIQGDMGVATLVTQPGGQWSLVAQRVPTIRLVELDEQSLLSALKDVMRP